MGWSTDWLHKLLLDRARTTWVEIKQASKRCNEVCPEYLAATEHTDWDRQYTMTFGAPARIWYSVDDFSSLCDSDVLKRDGTPVDPNRTLFRVPIISWYISDDRKQVLICRYLGPRYGNGGWWDVIGQGPRGMLVAAEGEKWIS